MIGNFGPFEYPLADRFRFEAELGRGAMGCVYRARDLRLDRLVAIKVLHPALTNELGARRFQSEIRIAAGLHHPNIVAIHDAGEAAERLFYVMDYLGGETLRHRLHREKQLPIEEALTIARQIAEGLQFAHDRGVVHRDVKPENIILADGCAKITDFGLARAFDVADAERLTASGVSVGTPQYVSPEQASAEKDVGPRADQYALACVLHEMLAGEAPFTGPTPAAVMMRHLTDTPLPLRSRRPTTPPSVESAVLTALEKVPADRFSSVKHFVDHAAGTAGTMPLAGYAPPQNAFPAKPRLRRPLFAAATIVGLAAVAAAFVFARVPAPSGASRVTADPRVIAVMYLDAPDGDTALAAIGRGITRDLIYSLRQVNDLQPITENGVRSFGPRAEPDSVARRLHAGTVIAGSVDRVNDSLQLDLRLVDAATLVEKAGVRLRYPRAMLLSMRDSAVRDVTHALLKPISKEVQDFVWRSGTQSADAWRLMQRARDLIDYADGLPLQPRDFGPQLRALSATQVLLDSARRFDPHWQDPVVEKGWTALRLAQLAPPAELGAMLDSTLAVVQAAQRQWPGSPPVLELRGAVAFERLKNGFNTSPMLLDSAEADLRAATAAPAPRARAWALLSSILGRKFDSTGSIVATLRALDADPYNRDVPRTMVSLVFRYLYSRQNDSARTFCASARARFPNDAYVQSCELSVLGWTGVGPADVNAMWKALDRTERAGAFPLEGGIFPVGRYWMAAVLARSSLPDSARHVLAATDERLRAAGHPGAYPMHQAYVRLMLGERDASLALLDTMIRRDPAKRSMIAALPWFDRLRDEGDFQRVVQAGSPRP